MYEASVNTDSAYNSIVGIQACEKKNENERICCWFFFLFFFHFIITFACAVSNLMFNSGEFCDSAADHNRVKVTEIRLWKCFRDKLTCLLHCG